MIRRLRGYHRFVFLVLSVVLPVLFVSAVLVYKPPAQMEALPDILMPTESASAKEVLNRSDLWRGFPLQTRVVYQSQIQRGILHLLPLEPIKQPDPILFWMAGTVDEALTGIPHDALILGKLGDQAWRVFDLPLLANGHEGSLILFSLAHGEVIASASLPAVALEQSDNESGGEE